MLFLPFERDGGNPGNDMKKHTKGLFSKRMFAILIAVLMLVTMTTPALANSSTGGGGYHIVGVK
jgi:hypothetical protein